MRVIKKSDKLKFDEEEISILKKAYAVIAEIWENVNDGNIDGWYEEDFDTTRELLNTLLKCGDTIDGEYCLDIDYD